MKAVDQLDNECSSSETGEMAPGNKLQYVAIYHATNNYLNVKVNSKSQLNDI